jgi:hypothetical protein
LFLGASFGDGEEAADSGVIGAGHGDANPGGGAAEDVVLSVKVLCLPV